ncbi:hypothetical protein L2E82_01875 [Cichorium intybus]|uniref:Uncharacterized protein n=1 Tax=Cichorium intybus TaxID=13427 RepID=A0ACB9H0W0_CICIN|nr:hypothetical protein L2E82_01875 [Cichorium intybus]
MGGDARRLQLQLQWGKSGTLAANSFNSLSNLDLWSLIIMRSSLQKEAPFITRYRRSCGILVGTRADLYTM